VYVIISLVEVSKGYRYYSFFGGGEISERQSLTVHSLKSGGVEDPATEGLEHQIGNKNIWRQMG
jgi:hypothetical protein